MLRSLAVVVAVLLSPARAEAFCSQLSGAAIIANDGTFLGTISSSFDSRSVLNEFGSHGSEFSSNSIWNEFGRYGGEFASLSPFNKFTSTPPMILMNGQVIGYLSVQNNGNTLNPYALKTCQ